MLRARVLWKRLSQTLRSFINGIEGVEAAGAKLEHVVLITGAKYYGVHLGPSAAPARETNPRHIGPNFYYTQETTCDRGRRQHGVGHILCRRI